MIMKWLNKIFGDISSKIPKSWLGRWEDKNGKQLIIELVNEKEGIYKVSCLDKFNQPYLIKGLSEQWKSINLTTTFAHDIHDEPALSVEAGEDGVGTTYGLKFGVIKQDNYRLANKSDELSIVLIIPNLGIGLYRDDEDDLGAPWAMPLETFKKVDDIKFIETYRTRRTNFNNFINANNLQIFTCPGCGYPTLEERGGYEICQVCNWEDNGQDDKDENEKLGGPNRISLTENRILIGKALEQAEIKTDPIEIIQILKMHNVKMEAISNSIPMDADTSHESWVEWRNAKKDLLKELVK
jgi:uncharacterized Zn finger protein (UPF0148 family)